MELGTALRVLARRWLVVLLGAALTLGAAGYLYTSIEPGYRATARLLLLLPADARGAEEAGSPYLYLPSGLNVLARVVVAAPLARSFEQRLLDQGLTSAYEVAVDPATPIINVGVEGPDPGNVMATRDGLVAAVQEELLRVQEEEDVPAKQLAHSRVFAAEDTPAQLSGDRTRAVLAVVGVGGLLTLLAAFALDALLARRRPRRHPAAPADPADPADPTDPADPADPTDPAVESS